MASSLVRCEPCALLSIPCLTAQTLNVMDERLIRLGCAGSHHDDATALNKLVEDLANDHRVLGAVLQAKDVSHNHLDELLS